MSRIAKNPVAVPAGVEIQLSDQQVTVKGPLGELTLTIHETVSIVRDGDILIVAPHDVEKTWAMAGTTRALLYNMVVGVTQGFEKKLQLVGVGYRAKVAGQTLHLTVGYSHPVEFNLPDGMTVQTPTQTDIVLKDINKQRIGQVAAKIRAIRPPEPYKGKGIRYTNEFIVRKEAKKK